MKHIPDNLSDRLGFLGSYLEMLKMQTWSSRDPEWGGAEGGNSTFCLRSQPTVGKSEQDVLLLQSQVLEPECFMAERGSWSCLWSEPPGRSRSRLAETPSRRSAEGGWVPGTSDLTAPHRTAGIHSTLRILKQNRSLSHPGQMVWALVYSRNWS